jgi:protein CpxP
MNLPIKHNRIKNLVGRSTAVLLCSAGLVLAAAHAQDTTTAPPPPPSGQQGPPPGGGPGGPGGGRGGMMNPERRVEMLQKQLKLSDDQTVQVKTIFADERSKTEALRANTSLSRKDMRSQMMAINQDRETKMHALLTPDQATKYDEMQAKERERMQERRENGQGGGNPPPPPPPTSL